MNPPWRRRDGDVRVKVIIGEIILHGGPSHAKAGFDPGAMARNHREGRRKRANTGLIYAALKIMVIACAYTVVSFYNWNTVASDPSGCHFKEQTSTSTDWIYWPLTQYRAYTPTSSRVAEIVIQPPDEPLEVTTNTCKGRSFMAELLKHLEQYRPKVIAIDKTYGADSCNEAAPNRALTSAFHEASVNYGIHLVVGQGTKSRENATPHDTDCLVQTPAFDFNQKAHLQGDKIVQVGLTRLNEETLKIPLRWWTFPSDKAVETFSDDDEEHLKDGTDTFSVQAAKQTEPGLLMDPALKQMFKDYEHPFARFPERPINSFGAVDLICTSSKVDSIVQRKFNCANAKRSGYDFSLLKGKTVVIGERVESDKRVLADKEVYGVDLQSDYVEALLDHRYIQQSWRWDVGLLFFFVIGTGVIAVLERVKNLSPWRALLWNLLLFVGVALVSFALLEIPTFNYFTPRLFLASGGIILLLVTQSLLLLLHGQIEQTTSKPDIAEQQ